MTPAQANEARFLAACAHGQDDSAVLALYTRLVRGNVRSLVQGILPRTAHALAARLESEVAAFLHERGAKTPHARDVPFELVAHCGARWEPWLHELARLELAEFRVSYAERGAAEARGELALDAPLALCTPLVLESFAFAVQADDPTAPDAHALLLYRDADEHVRTLRLTPMAHALLLDALAGASLQSALASAAAHCGLELDAASLESTARFLDDLSERGIVRGAA